MSAAPIATAGDAFGGFLANIGATVNSALAGWVEVEKTKAIASSQHGADRLPAANGPASQPVNFGGGLDLATILPLAALVLGAAFLLRKG